MPFYARQTVLSLAVLIDSTKQMGTNDVFLQQAAKKAPKDTI